MWQIVYQNSYSYLCWMCLSAVAVSFVSIIDASDDEVINDGVIMFVLPWINECTRICKREEKENEKWKTKRIAACTRVSFMKISQKFDVRRLDCAHSKYTHNYFMSKMMSTHPTPEINPIKWWRAHSHIRHSFWPATFICCQLSEMLFIKMLWFLLNLCCQLCSLSLSLSLCVVLVCGSVIIIIIINGQPPNGNIKLYAMAEFNVKHTYEKNWEKTGKCKTHLSPRVC